MQAGISGVVSSAMDSWLSPAGGSGGKTPEKLWPFLHLKDNVE